MKTVSSVKLKDLFRVGITNVLDEAGARFQNWKNSNKEVWENLAAAERAVSGLANYEPRWGGARGIYREYPLCDGRVVVKHGYSWTEPLPGGEKAVFYFK